MPKVSKEEAVAELERRANDALRSFTAEAYSTTVGGEVHKSQLRLLHSKSDRVLVYCTPRAGKTRSILWILINAALSCPNTSSLYLGITAEQAGRIAWRPWKRILKQWQIPHENAEANMATTFPNGSVCYFSGAQDVGSGAVYLGDSYAGGIVVLDECQDRPDAVIVPLIEDVIEDRLSDITDEHPYPGRLIVIGSLPKNEGGWFWRQITEEAYKWEVHSWSRLDNVFLKNQKEELRRWLERRKLTIQDEQCRRIWFGEPVWSKNGGRPYIYVKERNGYEPTRPAWVDEIVLRSGKIVAATPFVGVSDGVCAIDLGGSDRGSIQAIGFGPSIKVVQHLFDYTSERDAHLTWGELLDILQQVHDHYPFINRWVYDSDASKTEHDTLGREYGIPLIAAANKNQMVEQVRRLSDLLRRGIPKIMIGSAVEDDFNRAMWDPRELAKGKWKLAIGPNKVDASEAFRYCIAEWFSPQESDKPKQTQKTFVELAEQAPVIVPYGFQDDRQLSTWIGGLPEYGGPQMDIA